MSHLVAGRLLIYSALLSWDDAVFMIRIAGPLSAAGWTLIRGDVFDPDAIAVSDCDAVLMHRDYPAYGQNYRAVVARCKSLGKPLIYETDDLLTQLPDGHIAYLFFQVAREPMLEVIQCANAVIVSTNELKARFSKYNNNIHVVCNYLNDDIWHFRAPPAAVAKECVTVGYCAQTSHREDIDFLAPVFLKLHEMFGKRIRIKFWAIAPPEELRGLSGVSWHPLVVQNYHAFAQIMSEQECDIFVAPLVDNPFNRCKSAIKFLETTALGRPAVYSNLPPYSEIVNDGITGMLAKTADEWLQKLIALIEQPELRATIAADGQNFVRDNLLLSQNWQKTADTYRQILRAHRDNTPDRGDVLEHSSLSPA